MGKKAPFTPCYRGGYFLDLLPDVCDEARTQMVGRGTELPHPLRCSTSSIGNIQSMRALGGVRWRVFVAYCLMACSVARCMTCIRSTLLMIIPEEPEYMLLWLSDCEWNQLDGRVVGLDLIIGDFGEM